MNATRRRLGLLSVAVLVTGLSIGAAAPAFADDTLVDTVTDTVTQVAGDVTAPDPTPSDTPTDTAPPSDPAPTDPAPTDPVVTQPPVQQDDDGTLTKRVSWILPEGHDRNNNGFPQLLETDANLAAIPCGTTRDIQDDQYRYATDEERATVDALDDDGQLTAGEDSNVYISNIWRSYTAPACEQPPTVTTVTFPTIAATSVCYATEDVRDLSGAILLAGGEGITETVLNQEPFYTDDSGAAYVLAPGTYAVEGAVEDGYTLNEADLPEGYRAMDGDGDSVFHFQVDVTLEDKGVCVVTPPSGGNPGTPGGTVTQPSGGDAQPAAAITATQPDALATTGTNDPGVPLVWAALALLVGAGLVTTAAVRQRRRIAREG